MGKEKIDNKLAAEPSAERNELPPGKYEVRVEFKTRKGEDYAIDFDRPISLKRGEGMAELRKRALSGASWIGLHNFGMDAYSEQYRNSHPVKFTLWHENGREITFTHNFDGNGHPVKEK
jgi:hypothetical protein